MSNGPLDATARNSDGRWYFLEMIFFLHFLPCYFCRVAGTQLVLEGRPQEEIDTVMTFCHKVGLPITLTEVGVDVDDKAAIRAIADRTIAPGESSHNEPFEMTSEIVSDAMVATHWAGVRFQDKNQ